MKYQVDPDDYVILELHGKLAHREQEKEIFKEIPNSSGSAYITKVILCTNMAESSITIDRTTVVIDSGFELCARYDPENKITIL